MALRTGQTESLMFISLTGTLCLCILPRVASPIEAVSVPVSFSGSGTIPSSWPGSVSPLRSGSFPSSWSRPWSSTFSGSGLGPSSFPGSGSILSAGSGSWPFTSLRLQSVSFSGFGSVVFFGLRSVFFHGPFTLSRWGSVTLFGPDSLEEQQKSKSTFKYHFF